MNNEYYDDFSPDFYSVEQLAMFEFQLWIYGQRFEQLHFICSVSASELAQRAASRFAVWEKVQNTFTIRLCVTLFCMWPFSPTDSRCVSHDPIPSPNGTTHRAQQKSLRSSSLLYVVLQDAAADDAPASNCTTSSFT